MTVASPPRVDDQFAKPEPSRSPVRLRNNQLAATVAVLLFALLSIGQILQLRYDLTDRPPVTKQAVLVSELSTEVVRAGRIAAVMPLGGDQTGLKTSLAKASGLVVQAASAGANADDLIDVNSILGEYTSLLRQASATGNPAQSAALLASADQLLTTTLQPALDRLANSISQPSGEVAWLGWAIAGGGAVVIGILCWGWVRSSRLSHRVISPGLALGVVLVAGMTVLAFNTVAAATTTRVDTGAAGQASALTRLQVAVETSARLQATSVLTRQFTPEVAKAELAARQAATKAITNDTPDEVRLAASTSVDSLADSAALLAKSSWPQVSAVLTGTSASSLPSSLRALDVTCAAQSTSLAESGDPDPSELSSWLVLSAVGLMLLAAAAAVAIDRGIGARLKEYQ